jgi:hypothetical protein
MQSEHGDWLGCVNMSAEILSNPNSERLESEENERVELQLGVVE